jgi:hypothetical protein
MYVSKRLLVLFFVALLAVGGLVLAVGAAAGRGPSDDHGKGGKLFSSTLAPILGSADPAFHGVRPGGKAWRLERGNVRIKRNGDFDLRLKGLVLTSTGTPGPVATVSASLFCGADTTTAAAATTGQVPLSSTGDAHIEAKLSLPPACLAPIVLVHPNGEVTLYITVTGWRS